MNLTKQNIDAFKYEGGWDVRWDDKVPGLGVRIYPSGKKAFVLSFRAKGRKRLMVLGRWGADLTLSQAREGAQKHRVGLRDGVDPLEERRKGAKGKTLRDLCDDYLVDHAKPHKKTWRTDEGRLRRHIPAAWLGRKVSAITRNDVRALHAKIGATRPYEANRFLDLLRLMFGLARLWYPADELQDNPATGIKKYTEHSRKRWVTPEELPRLAEAIDAEPNVYIRAALWLYLLTGVRKSELLQRRWQDIAWDRAQIHLAETKSGEEQWAILNAPALAILQSVPPQEDNEHIFCGAKPGRHLVNIDKAWRRIRKAADMEDIHLHDLRRTTGAWLSQAQVDLNLVKDALRHQNIATTLIYARLGEDAAREPMEEHGRRIMEIAGKARPIQVDG